jgi:hypothetical protein
MAAYHRDKSLPGNPAITTKPISHGDKGGKKKKRMLKDRPISKIIESFKTGSKETQKPFFLLTTPLTLA